MWLDEKFKLKNRIENKVVFENKKDGLIYNILQDENQPDTNTIKHELVINDPSKFIGAECAYKALELEHLHLLCESYLNLVLLDAEKISEIML